MHFAYRNNNPGNIRPNQGFTWVGQIGVYDSGPSGEFLIFDTMENGVRAAARLAGNYPSVFGVSTMREFFSKYAPKGDGANDPDAYARSVADAVGLGMDTRVDFTDFAIVSKMLPRMFLIETGHPAAVHGVTKQVIEEGCRRAGNIKNVPAPDGYVKDEAGNIKRENVEKSRTIEDANKGMREAGIAGAAAAGGLIAALKDLNWYVALPIALAIAFGLALVVWRFATIKKNRREDNERGVR